MVCRILTAGKPEQDCSGWALGLGTKKPRKQFVFGVFRPYMFG